MINTLLHKLNLFQNHIFCSNSLSLNNPFPVIFSLLIIVLILILFTLQLIQLVSCGIVKTSSQTNYSYQPPYTVFTTNTNDPTYSPFMIAFALTNANTCSNASIAYDVNVNTATGTYNTANRTYANAPLNPELCNNSHFAMLPNGIAKLKQYTAQTLFCLPLNTYFEVGGANTLSSLYKSLRYNFSCPDSCSSPCGQVQFFFVNSNINLHNSSHPFSYSLNRKLFLVQKNLSFLNSYPIVSTNLSTDASLLPFSTKSTVRSVAAGSLSTDIPMASGDSSTVVVFQSSDGAVQLERSYYKVFDLVGYMGGVMYGMLALFFFVNYISRLEFQMRFASEYFRSREAKSYNLAGFMKQIAFGLFKDTKWKPDWRQAEARDHIKDSVNKVLDVVYLNKRIHFLQQAISLLFEPHQLRGIYLLHSLTPQQIDQRIQMHRFRDRTVYFLHKNWDKHPRTHRLSQIIPHHDPNHSTSNCHNTLIPPNSKYHNHHNHNLPDRQAARKGKVELTLQSDKNLLKQQANQFISKEEIRFEVAESRRQQDPRQGTTSLRDVIHTHLSKNILSEEELAQSSLSNIVNQAEQYYNQAETEAWTTERQTIKSELEREMEYVGEISLAELQQEQLAYELQTHVRRLIEQGEEAAGDSKSKRICERLDGWLKNQLKNTLKASLAHDHGLPLIHQMISH